MPNRVQALYNFWSSFGIPAIDEQSSYDTSTMQSLGLDYPYITYETGVGRQFDEITLSADIYYRSSTWVEIEAMAATIAAAIGESGRLLPCDNGCRWIKLGNPAYQRMGADNDFDVRRIHFDVTVEDL